MGKTTAPHRPESTVIPDALRKNLRPRRSSPVNAAAPTEAAVNRQWKRIKTHYSVKHPFGGEKTHADIYAAGLATKTEPELRPVRKAAHELLLEPSLEAVRTASIDVLGAAEAMLRRVDRESTLLDPVIVSRGLSDGLRVALRVTEFELGADHGYTTAVYVKSNDDHSVSWGEPWRPLRDALCVAPKADYDAAVKLALELRKGLDLARRAEIAYAFPDQPWADQDLLESAKLRKSGAKENINPQILLTAITRIDALRAYADAWGEHANLSGYALDLVQVLPEKELLPILAAEIPKLLVKPKYGPLLKTPPRAIAEAIACWRSPAVAAVLAQYVSHPVMAPLVLGFFRDAPELSAALREKAGAKPTASIGRVLGGRPAAKATKTAKASDVPAILRDMPWRAPAGKKPAEREVLTLTMKIGKESFALPRPVRPYEADASPTVVYRDIPAAKLAVWKKELAAGRYVHADYEYHHALGGGSREYHRIPKELGIPAWNTGKVGIAQSALQWAALHGLDVLEGFIARDWIKWLAWEGHEEYLDAALSYVSPRIAPSIAKAAQRKRARRAALVWLNAHPEVAALGLVPNALGPAGEAQRDAESALRLMQTDHRREIEKVAAGYGKDASRLVRALLDKDPLALDLAPPKPPPFLRLHELPPVTLRSGEAIGDAPRAALVELLQITPNDVPYAGLELVRKACDPASLGQLAEELLEQWVLGDLPGRHEWMMFACAHFPSESATRRMVALTREWARKNAAKAARLCAGLSAIGSDHALMALAHVADTTRYDKLKKEASQLLGDAAAARGLLKDELADRTVPDVGLSADGSLALSFGARSFVVTLDETLSPVVREKTKSGLAAATTSLPRPQKTDDAAKAKAARERFDLLKKDLAAITQRQLRRYERAMVDGRLWSAADFRERIAAHPLLSHMARRLVWESLPKKGAPRTFRLAEDGTLSDEQDRAFRLPEDAAVRLAHPARTPGLATTWATLLADYEILQPFPQVGRPVHTATKAEAAAKSLARTASIEVLPRKILGVLESRGWERKDAGYIGTFRRAVRGEDGAPLVAELALERGVEVAYLRNADAEKTRALFVHTPEDDTPLPLGRLDAVSFSELVGDAVALGGS